ncbi:MAG: nitroreductase family protein [Lysobacter sp.]
MLSQLKALAKYLLAIVWVRRLYEGALRFFLEILAANRLTSLVYSLISIPSFNREQFAVLRGRRDYYRNLTKARRSRTELRRNVHRLEKGILMRPRREVFALDYLVETIEFYERAVGQYSDGIEADDGELTWAFSVLNDYFSIVDATNPVVAAARQRFESARSAWQPEDILKVPYARAHGTKSQVRYEDLLALSMQRRSVRWFQRRDVPRELIDQALLVGRQSPSACNRLPYEFRIFDDAQMVQQVAAIPFGSAGYAHQIPTIAVVVGRLNHYFSPRDRHVIYVDSALAAMPFMLALETLGLASSVINWPDFEPLENKMQATLSLDVDERVIMLIAIGYPDPDGLVAYSEKKSLDVIRRYNDLGER